MHCTILFDQYWEYAFLTIKLSKLNLVFLCITTGLIVYSILNYSRFRRLSKELQEAKDSSHRLENEVQDLKEEIKDRTKNLKLAIEKSEEANRLKSLFLANMSHEIRTPLNAIMGFTELITEDNIDTNTRLLYSQHIIQNSQNLLKLMDQIFHLSIIETGKVRVVKERFRISDLIPAVTGEINRKISQSKKNIKLSLNIENENYEIFTDKEKLKLILENLFDNAIKFTSTGIIELTCLRMEKEFLFQITDSGSGINEAEMEMIFDPFTQGSETLKKIKGGSGLGLSNVKNYVILLGGKIWCEGNKPCGAIFTFTIPAPLIQKNEILKSLNYSLFQN